MVAFFVAIILCSSVLAYGSEMHEHYRKVLAAVAPFAFPQLYKCPIAAANAENEFKSQSQEDAWLYKNIVSKLPEKEQIAGTFVEIGA